MATLEKRKRKSPLGTPPGPNQTLGNLKEPEIAPGAKQCADGRARRRTGRVAQFGTKVHPNFKTKMAELAERTGKNYNVILEESVALFEANLK